MSNIYDVFKIGEINPNLYIFSFISEKEGAAR